MKRLFCIATLSVLTLAAQAADTAYTAIRVVAKKHGDEALGRVLEVHGLLGSPEPTVWKVVLADPGARGGVREYEVQRGRITAERAPSGRGGGAPLDLNKLNIDSDGAFTIANTEAQKSGTAFDRVDYDLSIGGRGPAVWHLELSDGHKGRVGSVDISADSGNVVGREFGGGGRGAPQDDRDFLRDQARRDHGGSPPDDRGRPYDDRRVYRGDDDDLGPGITDIFGKITRHFEHRGKQIKNFFTH